MPLCLRPAAPGAARATVIRRTRAQASACRTAALIGWTEPRACQSRAPRARWHTLPARTRRAHAPVLRHELGTGPPARATHKTHRALRAAAAEAFKKLPTSLCTLVVAHRSQSFRVGRFENRTRTCQFVVVRELLFVAVNRVVAFTSIHVDWFFASFTNCERPRSCQINCTEMFGYQKILQPSRTASSENDHNASVDSRKV
jgi:hypothetical protein